MFQQRHSSEFSGLVIVLVTNHDRSNVISDNAMPETCDGFAYDQVLHLEGAFIGIEGLGVSKEAGDLVVSNYAVTAQNFAGPEQPSQRHLRLVQ